MTGSVQMGAGWNGSLRDRMSPSLQRRIAQAEIEEQREAARQERQRQAEAELREQRAYVAAMLAAEERGEFVDVRAVLGGDFTGVGHTRAEFLQLAVAQQDREDALAAAADRRAFEAWQLQRVGGATADTSAPTPAQRAEWEETEQRAASYRARRRERSKTIQAARGLARMDRERGR
jgi:hypothetical protein